MLSFPRPEGLVEGYSDVIAGHAQRLQVVAGGIEQQVQALLTVKAKLSKGWFGSAAPTALEKLDSLILWLRTIQGATNDTAQAYATYGQDLARTNQEITALEQRAQQYHDEALAESRKYNNMGLRKEIMDNLTDGPYRLLRQDYEHAMSDYNGRAQAATDRLWQAYQKAADIQPY
jgi:hypothetical protein